MGYLGHVIITLLNLLLMGVNEGLLFDRYVYQHCENMIINDNYKLYRDQ